MCSQFLRCGLDLTAVSYDIVSMNGVSREWKLRSGCLKGMHLFMDVEFGNVQNLNVFAICLLYFS